MDRLAEAPPRSALLQKLVLIVFMIGVLGSLARNFLVGSDSAGFLELGTAVAFVVYIVTFIDLALGLAIMIACIGLSPEFSLGSFKDVRLEDFVVPALLLSWLSRALKNRDPLMPVMMAGPALLYLVSMVLSTWLGIVSETTSFWKSFLYLGKFIEYFLIFLLILNNIRTREEFRALVIFSVLVALAGGVLVFGSFSDAGVLGRVAGPSGETSNIYGGYLILHLAIALGLFLQARETSSRATAAAALVLLSLALLYTYSRTSLVAIFAAALGFAVFKNRRLLLLIFLAATLLPLLAPSAIWERITTIGGVVSAGPSPSSWGSRVWAWQIEGGKRFDRNPLLGFGLGSVPLGEVDNEYIRIFSDLGFLGLVCFVWLLLRLGRKANELTNTLRPDTFESGFAGGYWMSILALSVHAIGATSFTTIRTMETFMVLTGLFAVLHARHAEWGASVVRTEGGGTVLLASASILNPRT